MMMIAIFVFFILLVRGFFVKLWEGEKWWFKKQKFQKNLDRQFWGRPWILAGTGIGKFRVNCHRWRYVRTREWLWRREASVRTRRRRRKPLWDRRWNLVGNCTCNLRPCSYRCFRCRKRCLTRTRRYQRTVNNYTYKKIVLFLDRWCAKISKKKW